MGTKFGACFHSETPHDVAKMGILDAITRADAVNSAAGDLDKDNCSSHSEVLPWPQSAALYMGGQCASLNHTQREVVAAVRSRTSAGAAAARG